MSRDDSQETQLDGSEEIGEVAWGERWYPALPMENQLWICKQITLELLWNYTEMIERFTKDLYVEFYETEVLGDKKHHF